MTERSKTELVFYCKICNQRIEEERLIALPDTETCVHCSPVRRDIGFMVFSHKTAPVLVRPKDEESLRRAARANRRSR